MNAPPAASARDAAFLALVLADALKLGLPDPDYITLSPWLADSTSTPAVGFQFNDRNGRDPLPRLRAWARRFGADVSAKPRPSGTWHEADFTHSGVLFHCYAEIAGAPAGDDPCGACGQPLAAHARHGTHLDCPPAADAPQCPAALLRETGDWAAACVRDAGHEPLHWSAHDGDWDDSHPRHVPDLSAHKFPQPGGDDDEALPDCDGCGHREDVHLRDPYSAPIANGTCAYVLPSSGEACHCDAYRLPDGQPAVIVVNGIEQATRSTQ